MLSLAALALAPLGAGAQEFRCVGKDGKKYYGSTIPPQCLGQPVEQLSKSGSVIRRIDPEGDEKQRQAKAAEAAQKRKEDAANREETRRSRALLATYTSEKDVEDARKRALVDNEKAVKDVEARIAGIKKHQADLQKEMEFYKDPGKDAKGKPKPAAAVPPKLNEDIKNAEIDLSAQQQLLDAKKKEVEAINAKYDDDKKRYIALTKGK
jgi:chromosome segregation ATPase